jgi:hypothetical protein
VTAPKLAQGHRGRVYSWPPDADQPDIIEPAWSSIARHVTCLAGPQAYVHGDYVRDNIETLRGYAPDDLRKAVATSHRRAWDPKMHRGSATHSLIEKWLTGNPLQDRPAVSRYYDEAAPYVQAAKAFHKRWVDENLFVEHTIFNTTEHYAGTTDLIARLVDGTNAVIDWKTGGVYETAALQVCAYANGEWIGTPDGTRHEMPLIAKGIVVQLKGDATYSVHPINLSQALWGGVKALCAYAAWHAYAKNHAFGKEWTPEPKTGGTTT